MKKSKQLPIVEPFFSTYQFQASAGASIISNPSTVNWFINNCIHLECNRKFLLTDYTTPMVIVENASVFTVPFLSREMISTHFLNGQIHPIIRSMLDQEYYVHIYGMDDYYVEGKPFYHQKHFIHDTLICGYDQNDSTYTLMAYDSNWVYRPFKTSQKSFEKGLLTPTRKGELFGEIWALKPWPDIIQLDPHLICQKLKEYLSNDIDKFPLDVDDTVQGIAVHDFICLYLDMLKNGDKPYERIDRRIFRQVWEHKKMMLRRLQELEQALPSLGVISTQYEEVVNMANHLRMLYASYTIKRRDSLLPDLKQKLKLMKKTEADLLSVFTNRLEGVLQNDSLGTSL